MKLRISLITFLLISAVSGYLYAQGGQTAVPFLEMPASAEMYGMGYTSVAVHSQDPIAPYYNPAHLGIQSFNNNFSIGFNSSDWLSKFWPGLTIATYAVNGGIDLQHFIKGIPHVSLGLGYSNIKMNFGKFLVSGPNSPDIIDSYDSYDKADNFTLSFAIDYYIKASLGYTYKHVFSYGRPPVISDGKKKDFSATADLYDLGLFIEVPVVPILEKSFSRPVNIYNNISPVLDLTLGLSRSNLGQNSIYYISSDQADPLPRVARAGMGMLAGFKYEAGVVTIMPLTAKWSIEANDVLVKSKNPSGWEYQSGLGDINFFKEVLLGKTNYETEKLKGWELNFFETISLYGGRFEEDLEMGARRFNTNGWSIRTAGIFKVLRIVFPDLLGNNVLSYALNHLDFRYSASKSITDDPYAPLNNVKFSTFNVLFNGL